MEGSTNSLNGNNIEEKDEFAYLGSNIASTERDIQIRLGKAWGALHDLNKIWKSNLPEDLKRDFFRATVESVLVYGSTTWTLTAKLEASLDGAYTRMLRSALNISWKQHLTKKQLYANIPPITVIIRERRLNLQATVGAVRKSKSVTLCCGNQNMELFLLVGLPVLTFTN